MKNRIVRVVVGLVMMVVGGFPFVMDTPTPLMKPEMFLFGVIIYGLFFSGFYWGVSFVFNGIRGPREKRSAIAFKLESDPNELRAKKAFAMLLSRVCDIRVLDPLEDVEIARLFSVSGEFTCYSCLYGAYEGNEDPVAHALVLVYSAWAEVSMVWTIPTEDGGDDVWLQGETLRFDLIDEYDGKVTAEDVDIELANWRA